MVRLPISYVTATAPTATPLPDVWPGSPDCPAITVTEWPCGEVDRLDPSIVSGSQRDLWRGPKCRRALFKTYCNGHARHNDGCRAGETEKHGQSNR
jgi:hypothetical protein